MAKKRRRGPVSTRTALKTAESITTKNDFAGFKGLYIYIILAVLAGTPFLTGKYIEFNTPGPFDSGSYVYSAQHIADGARLGVDEKPSAMPMTLLMNFIGVKLFGFSETGPILIQGLLQLAAFAMVFIAVRKMCGSLAAVVSVTLAAVFLSAPLVAKFGNVKEQFMIAFMLITASSFILRRLDGKWWWTLVTGGAAINIYYFKQTGTSVIAAIVVYLLASLVAAPKRWRTVATEFMVIVAGAIIGILPLYCFYLWQDASATFFKTVPAYTLTNLVKLSVIAVAVYILVRLVIFFDLLTYLKKFRQVRRPIWICGAILIVAAFVPCMFFYHSMVIVDVVLPSDGHARQVKSIENPEYIESPEYKEVVAELKKIEEAGYMDYYKSLGKRGLTLKKGGELGYYLNSVAFVKYPKKIIGYPVNLIKSTSGRFARLISRGAGGDGYLGRQSIDRKVQSKKVFRFYLALILPVSMALASIAAGVVVLVLRFTGKKRKTTISDRLVFFLAIWWVLDMSFVWISPRSYEQYYLPLVASAAVLAGYICSFYSAKLKASANKLPWYGAGAFAVLVMLIMSWHIFFGLSRSPHSGTEYKRPNRAGGVEYYKRFGYAQALKRVADRKDGLIGSWEKVGSYIKDRTVEGDKIYVWGWYPGIYVQAQRLCPYKRAFEGEMHTKSPESLRATVDALLRSFKKNPPKYIVDSRKRHFPWDRPPLELWPTTTRGLLPNQKQVVDQYDKNYKKMLAEQIGPDEAARYESMAVFRKFVMDNYVPAEPKGYVQSGRKYLHRTFGTQRVYKLKKFKSPR